MQQRVPHTRRDTHRCSAAAVPGARCAQFGGVIPRAVVAAVGALVRLAKRRARTVASHTRLHDDQSKV